ncbi:MAG TPA: histidine phosphatase family protein [Burkholderiales bacterium]|jgi:probable phosphoglycerate mutase
MSHPIEDWHTRFQQLGLEALFTAAKARAPLKLKAKRFWFLRHGETEGNATRIIQHAEISLNERGFEQARLAGEALRGEAFTRVYGSTMTRAWQTAETVGRICGKTPIPEPRLRERWFGDLVGTTSVGLNWSQDPKNGERAADFATRMCDAAEALLADDVPTLLVAHGGNLYVLAFALNVEMKTEYIANATPLYFEFEEAAQQWRIKPLSAPAHGGPILAPN